MRGPSRGWRWQSLLALTLDDDKRALTLNGLQRCRAAYRGEEREEHAYWLLTRLQMSMCTTHNPDSRQAEKNVRSQSHVDPVCLCRWSLDDVLGS